ncbi:LuxR C-terminal-related transcriptional regulator [Pseudomonas sp. 148P]|uniref:LuxR C-terminal-related transcriptional regulator n=1 Tax=Pseudomonas ulcerans TaxID=3115852 RepID=A0ABU7HQM1_9PSED|nr:MULTISPECIES: LuxR C-terminal-related transcriptional regulator [unclassified Pseudomonas]MEE1923771.1 LuxR C-terminal-related transcriptional regulator [Pseudomonas sp. 147P]MEE1933831.1 LuxR C-terminal-related transcriptional regulator [Pseudomonas sp. 148P]
MMTKRELEVLELLVKAKTNKQIASDLNISVYTVRDHVSSLMRKANVGSRTQLVLMAVASNESGKMFFRAASC